MKRDKLGKASKADELLLSLETHDMANHSELDSPALMRAHMSKEVITQLYDFELIGYNY